MDVVRDLRCADDLVRIRVSLELLAAELGAEPVRSGPFARQSNAFRFRDRHPAHRVGVSGHGYSADRLRRKAFPTTDSELKLMAAAAIMGLSNRPNAG